MKFEARDLKPYAEPVSAESLVVGEDYFAVAYLDEDMLIPVVEPLVFVGRNLRSGDVDSVYFQDAESYREGLRFGPAAAEQGAKFRTGSVTNIYGYERALDELLRCSIRRRQRDRK